MYDIIDYLINIIIGLIIGIILGYVLFKKIEYHGLDSNDVVKEIHVDENGRKYKWVPRICMCLQMSYSSEK